MSLLDDNFNELRNLVKQGRELNFTSFEPVYYLVFDPSQILEVKRKLRSWIATLSRKDDFKVTEFSLAKEIHKIIDNHRWKNLWFKHEEKKGFDNSIYAKTIKEALTSKNGILEEFEKKLTKLSEVKNGLLLVSDVESLHPFMRVGQIEAHLQGKFDTPTVFLYPGKRTGKTGLKFLGFYPDDGNYRSVHIGG